jgi:hypothetical protein
MVNTPSGGQPNLQVPLSPNYQAAYTQLQTDLNTCIAMAKAIPAYGNPGGFASAAKVVTQLQDAVSFPTAGLTDNLQQYLDTLVTPVVNGVTEAFKLFPAHDHNTLA